MHTFFLFCTYAPYPTYASQRSGVVSGAVASNDAFPDKSDLLEIFTLHCLQLDNQSSPNILTESWKRCIR